MHSRSFKALEVGKRSPSKNIYEHVQNFIELVPGRYLYMLLVFEDFDETDFSYYSVFYNLSAIFYLMVVTPFLSSKLKLHDALILFIAVAIEAISLAVTPFAEVLWQMYLVSGFNAISYIKYSVVRSLLSKSFNSDEIGKVFSFLAVIAALAPVAGNPMFRQLYDATLKTFPGAAFLLAGFMMMLAAFGNLVVFSKRRHLVPPKEEVLRPTNEKASLELSTIGSSN